MFLTLVAPSTAAYSNQRIGQTELPDDGVSLHQDRGLSIFERRCYRKSPLTTVIHVALPSPDQQAQSEEFRAKAEAYRAQHPPSPDAESPLPPQTIAGVQTEGKRRINMLGAKMSDGQEVHVAEETWTAPDLKIALAQTSDDPRGEKISMAVTDLERAEPASALFQVPPDYKLVEQK